MNMVDIDDLIAELRATMKPSSHLDMKIMHVMLGPDKVRWRFLLYSASWPFLGFQYASATGSIDTARAILRAAMPGWIYRVAECSVSDDAWVIPDFNDPTRGKHFLEIFPSEAAHDPVEWFGTDVDLRPSGRPAIALCISMLIAWKKYQEYRKIMN